jgi:TusA-related sulfurtransferase
MTHRVDAWRLACPRPVMLAKKALETHDAITVIVDNAAAGENVSRMAAAAGSVTNMYEIKETMLGAGRLIRL